MFSPFDFKTGFYRRAEPPMFSCFGAREPDLVVKNSGWGGQSCREKFASDGRVFYAQTALQSYNFLRARAGWVRFRLIFQPPNPSFWGRIFGEDLKN